MIEIVVVEQYIAIFSEISTTMSDSQQNNGRRIQNHIICIYIPKLCSYWITTFKPYYFPTQTWSIFLMFVNSIFSFYSI